MTERYEVEIRRFRRVEKADLEVGGAYPVTCLIGGNSSGKTSTLRALGAALARWPTVYGVTKAKAEAVLHDPLQVGDAGSSGTQRSSTAAVAVRCLEGDDVLGAVKVSWPDQEVVERGRLPPQASAVAASIVNPLGKGGWLTFLESILPEAMPAQVDIGDALTAVGLNALMARDLAEEIVSGRLTWDQAAEQQMDSSRGAQRAWRSLTAGTWGERVGESWRPEGWLPSYETAAVADLHTAIATAKANVIRAAQRGVVSEVSKLTKQRGTLQDQLRAAAARADEERMAPLRNTLLAAREALSRHNGRPGERRLACAYCGQPNLLGLDADRQPVLEKAVGDPGELERLQAEHDARREQLQAELKAAEKASTDAVKYERPPNATERDLTAKLAELDLQIAALGSSTEPAETPEMVAARELLARLELELELVTTLRHALGHHRAVLAHRAAAEVLRPMGLRRKLLVEKVEEIVAPWLERYVPALFSGDAQAVRIDLEQDRMPLVAQVSPQHNETVEQVAYAGDANSVALRMRYLMQLLAAERDGSDMVLLDRVDTLSNDLILGLIEVCERVGVPALLAFTRSGYLPDVAKSMAAFVVKETGVKLRVYVIEDGVVSC